MAGRLAQGMIKLITHNSQLTTNKGFSLIEVITAIVLIAIIMIPVGMIGMEYVRSMVYADSLTTASNLARMEMGIVNSLSYDDPTLLNGYDSTTQDYAGYSYDLRRTVNYVAGTNNNLKRVRVRAFSSGSAGQLIELDTYVGNVQFGAGSAGGALGNEKDSFLVTGGNLGRNSLTNVTSRNTRTTGNITMTSVIITSTRARTLSTITLDGEAKFSGSAAIPANTPTTIELQKNFIMNSNASYTSGSFAFTSGPNQPYTITIVFVFYDGTQSVPYSWTY